MFDIALSVLVASTAILVVLFYRRIVARAIRQSVRRAKAKLADAKNNLHRTSIILAAAMANLILLAPVMHAGFVALLESVHVAHATGLIT